MTFQEAIAHFSSARTIVVGDIMLDRYTFGTVERISPEAPVPVLRKERERYVLGGAGNVAATLARLGARLARGCRRERSRRDSSARAPRGFRHRGSRCVHDSGAADEREASGRCRHPANRAVG